MTTESQHEAPVTRVINAMLYEAIHSGVSDIHIEQFEHKLSIGHYVDGIKKNLIDPPQPLGGHIVQQIKKMAKLKVDGNSPLPDGYMSLRVSDQPVDVRVSTLPSDNGERLVLHLLN